MAPVEVVGAYVSKLMIVVGNLCWGKLYRGFTQWFFLRSFLVKVFRYDNIAAQHGLLLSYITCLIQRGYPLLSMWLFTLICPMDVPYWCWQMRCASRTLVYSLPAWFMGWYMLLRSYTAIRFISGVVGWGALRVPPLLSNTIRYGGWWLRGPLEPDHWVPLS